MDLVAPELRLVQEWMGDDYLVERLVGRGRLSFVYALTTKAQPPQRLALKVIPPVIASDPAFQDRFLRDAPALRGRTHPGLAAVLLAQMTPDGSALLVQQWLDGEPLASVLARRRTLPIAIALRLIRQLCEALCAAGLAHGDLHPGNIYLCPAPRAVDSTDPAVDSDPCVSGSLKLVDFGVAPPLRVPAEEHPDLAPRLGTPAFMAPEQVQGAAATARSDQFVLGALFYQMVRGSSAFARPDDRPVDTLVRVLSGDPEPVALDSRIDRALRRALSKSAVLRYPSLAEFASQLCGAEPPPAKPPASAQTPRPALLDPRRLTRLAMGLLVGALLGCLALGLSLFQRRSRGVAVRPSSTAAPSLAVSPARAPNSPKPPPVVAQPVSPLSLADPGRPAAAPPLSTVQPVVPSPVLPAPTEPVRPVPPGEDPIRFRPRLSADAERAILRCISNYLPPRRAAVLRFVLTTPSPQDPRNFPSPRDAGALTQVAFVNCLRELARNPAFTRPTIPVEFTVSWGKP